MLTMQLNYKLLDLPEKKDNEIYLNESLIRDVVKEYESWYKFANIYIVSEHNIILTTQCLSGEESSDIVKTFGYITLFINYCPHNDSVTAYISKTWHAPTKKIITKIKTKGQLRTMIESEWMEFYSMNVDKSNNHI
jgi:hypothetical protein